MSRLIDADTLKEVLCLDDLIQLKAGIDGRIIDKLIDSTPTVDAVPVVRCEDCIYSSCARGGIFECCKHSKVRESNFGISTMFLERHERGFFCADGERRESE